MLQSTPAHRRNNAGAHLQNPKLTPLLEPLIPALTQAVHFMGFPPKASLSYMTSNPR